jgi:hypothetical protein
VNVSHDRGIQLTGAGDYFLEVVHFEPEQNAVTDWLCWVADRTMMMIGMPIVQLQDQPVTSPFSHVVPGVPQPLIFSTTMPSHKAEQSLVPSARRLNVATENEWLCAHIRFIIQRSRSCYSKLCMALIRQGWSTFKT